MRHTSSSFCGTHPSVSYILACVHSFKQNPRTIWCFRSMRVLLRDWLRHLGLTPYASPWDIQVHGPR
ncbi:unnamed protein product [Chrysoparadoxa australica]